MGCGGSNGGMRRYHSKTVRKDYIIVIIIAITVYSVSDFVGNGCVPPRFKNDSGLDIDSVFAKNVGTVFIKTTIL